MCHSAAPALHRSQPVVTGLTATAPVWTDHEMREGARALVIRPSMHLHGVSMSSTRNLRDASSSAEVILQ